MQRLRAQAAEQSGIPYSVVEEVRKANLYQTLGWDAIKSISNAFYDHVYSDKEWFRSLFANTTREAAVRNQSEFLAQEFGGPMLYKQRKGHTAILGRHGPYGVDGRAAERWLQHMEHAVHKVVKEEHIRTLMMSYFKHMAWYIVYGKQLVNGMRTVGYYGKHKEGQT